MINKDPTQCTFSKFTFIIIIIMIIIIIIIIIIFMFLPCILIIYTYYYTNKCTRTRVGTLIVATIYLIKSKSQGLKPLWLRLDS